MAKRAFKLPAIVTMLDDLSESAFGMPSSEAIHKDICVICKGPATEFKDDISAAEYRISGLCQKCQDWMFAPPGDEE